MDDFRAEFQDWYNNAYPRKRDPIAAFKAYVAARKRGESADKLKKEARRYAAERAGEDPKFTKHPATWLNRGCYDDEPEAKYIKQDKNAYTPRVTAEQRRALVEKQLAEREHNEAPRESRPSYEDIQADLARRGLLIGSKRVDH